MTLPLILSSKMRTLVYFLVMLIMVSAMHLPTSLFAAGAEHEELPRDTKENAEQLAREMKEVAKKYPALSKRLGLLKISGHRIPMLCAGGVDQFCHDITQDLCIQDAIKSGFKPDYNHCLDLANRSCCRPQVNAVVE